MWTECGIEIGTIADYVSVCMENCPVNKYYIIELILLASSSVLRKRVDRGVDRVVDEIGGYKCV